MVLEGMKLPRRLSQGWGLCSPGVRRSGPPLSPSAALTLLIFSSAHLEVRATAACGSVCPTACIASNACAGCTGGHCSSTGLCTEDSSFTSQCGGGSGGGSAASDTAGLKDCSSSDDCPEPKNSFICTDGKARATFLLPVCPPVAPSAPRTIAMLCGAVCAVCSGHLSNGSR